MNSLYSRRKPRKVDTRLGTWSVGSLYNGASLIAVVKRYQIKRFSESQEVREDRGSTDRAGQYAFFYPKVKENHELVQGFCA
jgi:hypothetical protein